MSNYKTWFFDEEYSEFNNVKEILQNYPFKFKMMSHEQFNKKGELKPHYHILVELEENDKTSWNNFMSVIKRKYKLVERNKKLREKNKGAGGQTCFGSAPVYEAETYKRYVAKDGKIWGNIPEPELKKLIEEGDLKKQKSEWKDECRKYVKDNYLKCLYHEIPEYMDSYEYKIYYWIVAFYNKKEVPFTKAVLKNMYSYIVSTNKDFTIEKQLYLILKQ